MKKKFWDTLYFNCLSPCKSDHHSLHVSFYLLSSTAYNIPVQSLNRGISVESDNTVCLIPSTVIDPCKYNKMTNEDILSLYGSNLDEHRKQTKEPIRSKYKPSFVHKSSAHLYRPSAPSREYLLLFYDLSLFFWTSAWS